MQPSYDQSHLFVTRDTFVVVPTQHGKVTNQNALLIHRKDGSVTLTSPSTLTSLSQTRRRVIHGVVGLVKGHAQTYLVVVSRKVRVGDLAGHTIWRLDSVDLLPLKPCAESSEAFLLKRVLIQTFSQPYFYFSYTGDITNTRQRIFDMGTQDTKLDSRFVWNDFALSPLIAEALPFCVRLIHGAVFINRVTVAGKGFVWAIISRRAKVRVGARMHVRGADQDGKVANFVETEQIVEYEGSVASFVQTRGSMPMCWQQYPDLRYKPPPKMVASADSESAFLAHFKEQLPIYGKQVIVNLIDQKKAEGELEVNLRQLVEAAQLKDVHYIPFDFHKECSKMRYDRLSILMDKLAPFLMDFEYFFYSPNAQAQSLKRQHGVFRTNCIDCLDRTNVVQSLLAMENLKVVLKRFAILAPSDDLTNYANFQSIFRNTWADHADYISVQYAGTGALKTDFTRTGTRTRKGLLQDGWNAANRYFINNFLDGEKTAALRVFTGESTLESYSKAHSAHRRNTDPTVAYLPALLLGCLLVLVFTLISCQQVGLKFIFIVGACLAFIYLIGKMMMASGEQFVDPALTMKKVK